MALLKFHAMSNPVQDIKRRARERGIFMTAVCAEAGIHDSQASRWMRGRVRPYWESVQALEEALQRLLDQCDAPTPEEPGAPPRID